MQIVMNNMAPEEPKKRKHSAILSTLTSERPRGKLLKRHAAVDENESDEAKWTGDDLILENKVQKTKPNSSKQAKSRESNGARKVVRTF